jgi:archaeal flagellar protein FlaJ
MKFDFFKKKEKGELKGETEKGLKGSKEAAAIDKADLAAKFAARKAAVNNPADAKASKAKFADEKAATDIHVAKKEDLYPKAKRGIFGQKSKGLSHEMNRLQALKEKKIFSHDKRREFTIRGFIKAIDLEENLEKAGIKKDAKHVTKALIRLNTIICIVLTVLLLIIGFYNGRSLSGMLVFLIGGWITGFPLLLAIIWSVYLFMLDMKLFQRTKAVEQVFPDFLQLASSNISAGMPVDKALWYAVRPNFGVLAKEIEIVAKNTMAGEDLGQALRDFAKKYNSKVIARSINLMLEGLAAGGEMADLLNKIALNIEETRILKKEMAANVTTYVIFITFATIMAAPFLFALSTQLLTIIKEITGRMGSTMGSTSSFFSMSFSSESVKVSDFKIFSYVTLAISAFSSACIVTMIQKGRIKEGLSKIPVYILVSVVLYTLGCLIIGGMFGGMFG